MGSRLSITLLSIKLLALAALTTAAQAQDKAGDVIARGEYLARAGDCTACHTAAEGRLFAGGRADADPVRHDLHLQHHARSGDRHRQVERGRFLQDHAHRPFPGWRADLSGDAVRVLHQGHARRQRRDLRLSALDPAGEPEEQAARAALSLRQPPAHPRLAHAVLPRGRVQARPDQVGGMESRRLSGRGPRPLRHVPFADQRARRHLAIGRLQGRPDPDAELVRAVAHLEP